MEHLGVIGRPMDEVQIFCDSQARMAYTKDPKYHSKAKHKDTKYNFVRDIMTRKEIAWHYIVGTRW